MTGIEAFHKQSLEHVPPPPTSPTPPEGFMEIGWAILTSSGDMLSSFPSCNVGKQILDRLIFPDPLFYTLPQRSPRIHQQDKTRTWRGSSTVEQLRLQTASEEQILWLPPPQRSAQRNTTGWERVQTTTGAHPTQTKAEVCPSDLGTNNHHRPQQSHLNTYEALTKSLFVLKLIFFSHYVLWKATDPVFLIKGTSDLLFESTCTCT